MATKISQLSSASTLDGTELIPVVQGGVTKQASTANVVSGGIIQVQATTLDTVVTTSNTDATGIGADVGFNISITPKGNNSSFYITLNIGAGSCTNADSWGGILSRDGTRIGNGVVVSTHTGAWFRSIDHAGAAGNDGNHGIGASASYLDTTGSVAGTPITFICGIAGQTGTVYINRTESDYNGALNMAASRTSSTFTVMEIAQ